MAGPIIVEGPDGQEYEFPEGTSPDVMKQAMRKRYASNAPAQPPSPFIQKGVDMVSSAQATPPQMRASLPAATGPDRLQNRTDSAVLAKARDVQADIANATRKARVKPVDRRAEEAGRAETQRVMGGFDSPLTMAMGGNAAQIAGQAAGQQVYDEAGVASPSGALQVRGLNSMALGIPAMVNEDFRNQVGMAGRDRPGESLAGDIAGFLVPGELGWKAGGATYNATLKPLVNALLPKGGSALARGTRFAERGAENVAAWSGQNALMQGTVSASTQAAEQDRPVTVADMASGAEAGATDPFNVLGPAALMGLNRIFKYASTGGRTATPDNIAREVAGSTAGRSGSGTVLNAEALGGPVDGRAERVLTRMLGEVGYRPNDIRAALASFDQLANQTTDLPTLTARLKDVLIDQLGPRAEQVIQDFLQGAGVSRGGTAGQAVSDAASADYGRLGQFLEDSANARLGAGSRYDTLTGAQQEMERIGKEGYERTFNAPAPDAAAVDDLKQALDFFANSELASPLRQIASGKMLNVEQMIAKDPRRAAHWMQMAAGQKAQEAFDAGNKVLGNAYTDMRNQILKRLENEGVAPGYQQARMQFGDEFGIEQAVTFGSRFFTKVTDTVGVRQLAEDLRNLTPDQQEAALLSIRDELLRLAGRGREGSAPRLTQLNTDASLGGLETVVGEKGGQLANDIRFIDERLARVRRTDPGANSRTASNQEARDFADRAVSNRIVRTVGNALKAIGGDAILTSATGAPTPIMMARGLAGKAGESLARGRQGKIDDVTSLLLRDVGPQSRSPMPGDDMPPLTTRDPSGGAPPPASGGQSVGRGFVPSMSTPANQPANALSGVRSNGFSIPTSVGDAVVSGAVGSGTGSVMGMQYDLNGDGKIDDTDKMIGAAGGMALFMGGPRAYGAAKNALSDVSQAGFGAGGKKPPKPDSPEAIAAAVKGIATKKTPEPTRLERMVEEGKNASVPPINTLPREADALGAQAERMAARGLTPIEIYDQTGVAMIPYNGGSVPIVSPAMGPEELTRKFYAWLAQPPAKRPDWVKDIISKAPRKKGLMLTEKAPAPVQTNALAEQPLPKAGFPYGGVAVGTLAGAATGIPAGALAGYAMTRDQNRPRNALSGQ